MMAFKLGCCDGSVRRTGNNIHTIFHGFTNPEMTVECPNHKGGSGLEALETESFVLNSPKCLDLFEKYKVHIVEENLKKSVEMNVRLLYWKGSAVRKTPMILFGDVELSQISDTHIEVHSGTYDLPNDSRELCQELFELFNSIRNPLSNPKSQEFIRNNWLHTSMSVGDLVEISRDGGHETWVCASCGWRKL